MTKKAENEIVSLEMAIIRIKTLFFKTNETIKITKIEQVNFNIHVETGVDIPNNLVALTVKISFNTESDINTKLLEGDFQTTFAIKELENWKKPDTANEVSLPDDINYTMLTISISHARALLSSLAANGPYQTMLLPLLTKDWLETELLKTKQ
ncbi:MAG: hypothetical protein JNL57_12910 [Bacteroidetes bacterium]|nr:hypothetical protein [Bacteroidota bacterium]